MKYLLFCLLFEAFGLQAQTFEKNYEGYWGDTYWKFDFHANGTYDRVSSGHYGQTEVKGTYALSGDSLHMLSGHADSHGTIGEWYVFDDDSLLVDLHSLYEYRPKPKKFSEIPMSIKRYDINGAFPANDTVRISPTEYEQLLLRYTPSVASQSWEDWSETEHRTLIRLYNAQHSLSDMKLLEEISLFMRAFDAEKYGLFLMDKYEFTLSRGGGMYFPELKIEFGGELHPTSYFTVE